MAFSTTSQILVDGPSNLVVLISGTSDGEQETNAVKIDVSSLSPPCDRLTLQKVSGSVNWGVVALAWDDPIAPVPVVYLENTVDLEVGNLGGIANRNPDSNGDLLVSTQWFDAGSNYNLLIYAVKK